MIKNALVKEAEKSKILISTFPKVIYNFYINIFLNKLTYFLDSVIKNNFEPSTQYLDQANEYLRLEKEFDPFSLSIFLQEFQTKYKKESYKNYYSKILVFIQKFIEDFSSLYHSLKRAIEKESYIKILYFLKKMNGATGTFQP